MERSTEEKNKLRKKLVQVELKKLHDKNYIQSNVYQHVLNAHQHYYEDLEKGPTKVKEQVEAEIKPVTPVATEPVKAVEKKIVAKKPVTAKEARERNITWSLSIGVIFLLIAGTFLATSTWDMLSSWMKTGLITVVSFLFFGLAIFTTRILKIKKTAFAFHVLGSLFLPIIILSIGFYQQFGPYLSLFGEGRFYFGALGSLIIFPIYLSLAKKLNARLFVWFSYVTFTLFVGFLLASFHFPIDGFYFGMMLYNSVLVIVYLWMRRKNVWQLFTKELLLFIQVNLVLSTLLLLFFYSNPVAYGFNLLLTAVIYLAMIFVTSHKNYHFIFTVMLIYGTYQMIEFSAVQEIGPVVYALLGFVFLSIPKVVKDASTMEKMFQMTSAFVSGLAFLYITVQGVFLRMDQPSLLLVIGYVLIALNFTYLSNVGKRMLFYYVSPIFFLTALFELVRYGQMLFAYEQVVLVMFFAACLYYILFGCMMRFAFFQAIKDSSRDMALVAMLFCLFIVFFTNHWWQAGTMLLFLSMIALCMDRFEEREIFIKGNPAAWFHALALGCSVVMFYTAWQLEQFYHDTIHGAIGFVCASVVVLLASYVWYVLKRKPFSTSALFVAEGFYLLGMLASFQFFGGVSSIIRACIFFGGIWMAYILYRQTKWRFSAFAVSMITLLFYLNTLYVLHDHLHITSEWVQAFEFMIGAVVLFVIGLMYHKYDNVMLQAFWWVGHVYLPFTLLVPMFAFDKIALWPVLLATAIYALSGRYTAVTWKIYTFLYASFTGGWLAITYLFITFNLDDDIHYAWLMMSILLLTGWYMSGEALRKKMTYYIVPFSVIGIFIFTFMYPFDLTNLAVTLFYIGIVLVFMKVVKFDFFTFVPLLFAMKAMTHYHYFQPEHSYVIAVLVAVIMLAVGIWQYKDLYEARGKNRLPVIDWYTAFGFMALFSLYSLAGASLFEQLLPGILISIGLFIQRKRVPAVSSKWISFFAGAYVLEPYYTLLDYVRVPTLFEMELFVLPWIALAILLRKVASEKQKEVVSYIQWAVLVMVSLLLVRDGLQSGTVYDAIILGTLSLLSMLGGMMYKVKSFFFVGAGVLLLNVFLQTRPFWGAMPWWVYLLIAGTILIAVASYNEWHKQKVAEGKSTLFTKLYTNIIQKIKEWE